eukprot:393498-Amphidinium_carterae.1
MRTPPDTERLIAAMVAAYVDQVARQPKQGGGHSSSAFATDSSDDNKSSGNSAVTPNPSNSTHAKFPSWRSRHIIICGKAVRIAKVEGQIIVTFVATTNQFADPLTTPIGTQINHRFFSEWGLVKMTA